MRGAVMAPTHGGLRGMTRWLAAGVAAAALFVAALVYSAPVDAAVWCNGQYTNYCPLVGTYYNGTVAYNPFYYNGVYNAGMYAYAYRQYTDNRTNCPDGQVTQTPGGYFCTNYGVPAYVVNGNMPYVYAGGYYPYANYGVVYGVPYSGRVRVG